MPTGGAGNAYFGCLGELEFIGCNLCNFLSFKGSLLCYNAMLQEAVPYSTSSVCPFIVHLALNDLPEYNRGSESSPGPLVLYV